MRECLKKLKGKTVNVEGQLKHISVCSNSNKNYNSERRNNYDKYVRVTIMNVKSAGHHLHHIVVFLPYRHVDVLAENLGGTIAFKGIVEAYSKKVYDKGLQLGYRKQDYSIKFKSHLRCYPKESDVKNYEH